MAFSDFVISQGDLLPAIEATLTDGDGNPVDLSSASVKFVMHQVDADVAAVNANATADPDQVTNKGVVRYSWASGDTDVPGVYRAEWVGTFATKPETFPNGNKLVVKITPALA